LGEGGNLSTLRRRLALELLHALEHALQQSLDTATGSLA
jgi:hypothetical protein